MGQLLLAGLIDGINPVMFAGAAFLFLAMLTVSPDAKGTVVIGSCFVLGSILAYLLFGLGVLEPFRKFEIFYLLSSSMNILIALGALVAGSLSMYDWWVYKKYADPQKFILKFPAIAKKPAQAVGAKGFFFLLRAGAVIFILSFFSFMAESTYASNTYLPTMFLFAKIKGLASDAIVSVCFYSLAFVWLILATFFVARWIVKSERMREIARKYLSTIKIIGSAVFLSLGLGLLFLGS